MDLTIGKKSKNSYCGQLFVILCLLFLCIHISVSVSVKNESISIYNLYFFSYVLCIRLNFNKRCANSIMFVKQLQWDILLF